MLPMLVQSTANVNDFSILYYCYIQRLFNQTSTHTHTHTFNGPLSGTTQVGRYQKGKTNLDFTVARESDDRLTAFDLGQPG